MTVPATIVLVDTQGGTAPEFITAALARHPDVDALPGLAFVRDELRLYRQHRLDGLDSATVFDRLWQPSVEPGGRLWAGIARHLPEAERNALPLATARRLFSSRYDASAGYLATLATFAGAVMEGFGWSRASGTGPDATHLALCGVPFLKTVDWTELAQSGCVVVESAVPLDIWLALISHRSVVRCPNALVYWIIHKLLYRLAAQRGVRIVRCDAIDAGRSGTLDPSLLRAAGLEAGRPPRPAGPGHLAFSAGTFGHVERLARDIATVYGHTALFALARDVDAWADGALADATLAGLLEEYLRYWQSTAHIHFDTSSPCEQAVARRVRELVGPATEGTPELSCHFYEQLVAFQSYDFETPRLGTHTWLGSLEDSIVVPHAPYFLHAALCYLEHCLEMQGKWFDSFRSVSESRLYQRLTSAEYAAPVERLGFGERLARLARQDEEIRQRAGGRLAG